MFSKISCILQATIKSIFMVNIAIFASGSGTNAQKIIEYFSESDKIRVGMILSNRKDAYVIERALKYNIPAFTFTNSDLKNSSIVVKKLKAEKVDYIVLAGFLLKIPDNILKLYSRKIVNIHPALLPKYGGKGMYGMHVHDAVILSGDKESGITIHYVNEKYDDGEIIFQAKCNVTDIDTAKSIAEKVHVLEHRYYPQIIEKIINRIL